MINHAKTKYRDGILLAAKAATEEYADIISTAAWRFIPAYVISLAADWRLKWKKTKF